MTRPLTGQRKVGRPAVASCFTFGGSGVSAAGDTTLAVGCAGAAGTVATICGTGAAVFGCAIFGWAILGGASCGCATMGAGLAGTAAGGATAGCRAASCWGAPFMPGMMMRSPTFTMVDGG